MLPDCMRRKAFVVGGISGTIFVPVRSSMLRQAMESTSRVRRPRKSIFNRPRSGVVTVVLVMMLLPLGVALHGKYGSPEGSRQIMVAQACTPLQRTWPSMDSAASMMRLTSSSVP